MAIARLLQRDRHRFVLEQDGRAGGGVDVGLRRPAHDPLPADAR
jgi:hypothetical protein